MKAWCIALAGLGVIFAGILSVSTPAQAQTALAVPFDTATFQWTIPTPDATHSAAVSHVVTCGASTLIVNAPANTALIKNVVAAPGTYTCTVQAQNPFGLSAAVTFPSFDAGYPPLSPTNPLIVVP